MPKKTKKPVREADVTEVIRGVFPDGIVTEDVIHDEDSYYDEIRDEVRTALHRIKGADPLYDRPPEGRPHWDEDADPDEDPPAWVEEAASYDLLFLALRGEQFQFEGELEEEDWPEGADEPILVKLPTVGNIGCAVGVSIVAPFAVIRFTEMESSESGSRTLPDIDACMFNLDWTELDMEAHYEELFLEEGITALRDLREEIARVLGAFGIQALPEQVLDTLVPELRAEEPLSLVLGKETVTVEEALFFRSF